MPAATRPNPAGFFVGFTPHPRRTPYKLIANRGRMVVGRVRPTKMFHGQMPGKLNDYFRNRKDV
jgi:hypothetical protein